MKSLAREMILKEKITTTRAKAKELSPFAEKCVTTAKKNDLAAIRRLARFFSKDAVSKLIKEIGPRYKERAGGYTRIIQLGQRKSDGASMAIIEFVK